MEKIPINENERDLSFDGIQNIRNELILSIPRVLDEIKNEVDAEKFESDLKEVLQATTYIFDIFKGPFTKNTDHCAEIFAIYLKLIGKNSLSENYLKAYKDKKNSF